MSALTRLAAINDHPFLGGLSLSLEALNVDIISWTQPLCRPPHPPYIHPMFTDLYNTDILTLSSTLEKASLSTPDGTARKVSKLCGSWLEIDLNVEGSVVSDCAMRVQACALGQASAAILKESIIGASLDELTAARDSLREMLKAGGEPPTGRFAKLAILQGVAKYPARHTSTMLAFDAAVAGFENAQEKAA